MQDEDEGVGPPPSRASYTATQDLLDNIPRNEQVRLLDHFLERD